MENIVKITSMVNIEDKTEEQYIEDAVKLVSEYDKSMDIAELGTEDIEYVVKLYYFAPLIGKVFVVVSDEDKDILESDSNVIANKLISEYEFARIPAQAITYKEVVLKRSSEKTLDDAKNLAQYIADKALNETPYKLPIVKVINYKESTESFYVLPSIFGDNMFISSDVDVVNDGDYNSGKEISDGHPDFQVLVSSNGRVELLKDEIYWAKKVSYDFVGTPLTGANADYIFSTTVADNKPLRSYIYSSVVIQGEEVSSIKINGEELVAGMSESDFAEKYYNEDGVFIAHIEIEFSDIIENIGLTNNLYLGNYISKQYGYTNMEITNIKLS